MPGEKEIREKILGLVSSNKNGLTISDVSRLLDIHYTTASKYLMVLEAEKHLTHRQIGMAKLFSTNGSHAEIEDDNGRNLNLGKFFVVFLFAIALSATAFAVPSKIPLNGRLTFSNDTDINGTANFTFKIYNAKTDGSMLWQELQQNITVRRGLLSVYIGNNTPINLSFDENYFLEIIINGETIEPRFDFGTQAYSFASNQTLFTKNDTKVLGNLTPVANGSILGSSAVSWLTGYFNNLVASTLNVTDIFLRGANLSASLAADNTTLGNRIATQETRQAADNNTLANNLTSTNARIGQVDSRIGSNNQTLSDRIDSITSGTSDNTTQANLITGNNNTLSGRISATEANNQTLTDLINSISGSGDNTTQANLITGNNNTLTAQISGNNQTLTDSITSNNNTLTNMKANLTTSNNFTGVWNYFANLTANIINATGSFFVNGVDIFTRINSNNQTITNNLSTLGSRVGSLETTQSSDNTTLGNRVGSLETKQSADNTTVSTRITTLEADNMTQGNLINTVTSRQGSDNTTLSNRVTTLESDNTTQSGLITTVTNRQSSDNTTTSNRIGTQETKQTADNTTLTNRIDAISGGSSDNTTQANLISGNNNTLTASLGQKLNLTGGTLSSLLTISGTGVAGNISLSVNNTLYVNASGFVGIGTPSPASKLDVYGTLTVEGVNVTGRQASDNTTQANLISTVTSRQSSDNTTQGDRIGAQETKQSSDNTTISGRITTLESDNTTQGDLITTITSRQGSDNTTASNRAGALETQQSADNTTISNRLGTASSDNTTQSGLITGNNNTLYAVLGQKLNLTGGIVSGLFTILNISTTNNLSLNISGALYVNSSQERVGIGTANPSSRLDVSGTLTVEGVNVTGRQLSDNITTGGRIGSQETKQSADNTTASNRIESLETKQAADNTTVSNRIATLESDNTTQGGLITTALNRQSSDNTTLSDRIDSVSGSSDNTTQANLITGNNNTLAGILGQKLNLTGGILSGLFTILNISSTNNLSLNISGALYVNSSLERVGIGTANPSSRLDVSGTLTVEGINVTGKQISDNTTIKNALTSDNTTQNARISAVESNNQTLSDRIGSQETKQSSDNTTLSNRITGNNNTILDTLNLKANISTFNNFTAPWNQFNNATLNIANITQINASRITVTTLNATGGISCGMITGGSDGDFCADTSGAGATDDNTTQENKITGNNNTILDALNTKPNFTSVNNFTGVWNWFANVTADMINVTNGLFSGGVNYITRINSNNQTISDRIASVETQQSSDNTTTSDRIGSLETKQSSDNTTLSNRIAGNNNTLAGSIGTKVNLTASGSFQCSAGEYVGNVTTLGGIVTSVTCINQTGSDDNTTQANLITGNNNTLGARINGNNNTLGNRIGTLETQQSADNSTLNNQQASDNTTVKNAITSANNTLLGIAGQKLNLTGGIISGLFQVGNVSSVNNISVNLSNALYVNSSFGWIGINRPNPSSALDIGGTLTVEGINVTGRQISDNTSIKNTQSSDNTTLGNKIATLQADNTTQNNRITSNNQTLSDLISGNNQTLSDRISGFLSTSDNNTLTNLKANLTTVNNFTGVWNWFANVTADSYNATRDVFIGGVGIFSRANSNNQTITDNLTSTGTRIGNLEAKQSGDNTTLTNRFSGDNTTQANLITGNNNTILDALNTKPNFTSVNNFTGAWNWFRNVTVDQINVTTGIFSGGVNYITRINSNNQTIADNLTTTNARIGNLETKQSGDNTTLSDRIGGDNTTQSNLITGNNNTILNLLNLKSNISTFNNFTGTWNQFRNVTLNVLNATFINVSSINITGSINVTGGISCGLITGGADGDFCDDASAAGGTEDNTTQANLITGNNNTLSNRIATTEANNQTLTNLKANLTTFNNFTGVWNWFRNVTADSYNATRDVFIGGTGIFSRLNSNNQTIADNLSSTNARIGTVDARQSGDNTTLADNLTTTNTRIGNLESKQSSDNTTLTNAMVSTSATNNFTAPWNWFANLTADMVNVTSGLFSGGVNYITRINSNNQTISDNITTTNTRIGDLETKQSGDNTTLNNQQVSDNTTLGNAIISNNNTLVGVAGAKVNNTGGSYIGNFTLLGLFNVTSRVANTNNLTLTVNDSLYFNMSQGGYLGLRTSSPKSWLDIGGNLSIGGTIFATSGGSTYNLTGRIDSNNQTLSNLKANISGDRFTGSVEISTIANLTLTTARLNVTQNTTIRNTNNAGNNSAIKFYDTNGVCQSQMYYNGTHFVIDGSC